MKASVFVGVSVDGFLARPDGALDFLDEGGSEPHGYEEFFASVDVLVIGRKTYETVLAFESWPYGSKAVVVLATNPVPLRAGVERLSGPPSEIVAALEARGFRHAYVDGGITIQRFLAAGLIQRVTVSRVPVLIGRGISLFGDLPSDVRLRHVMTRAFPGGLVQSEYEVVLQ